MQALMVEGRWLAETTSIRGISRVVKSDHLLLRVLWGVSVVTFVGMALVQTIMQITSFFNYPYNTVLREQSLNITELDIQMPDLTVCNLNPLAERAFTNDDVTSFQRYTQMVKAETNHFRERIENILLNPALANLKATKEKLKVMREFLLSKQQRYLSLRGYYSHISQREARLAGHSQEEFIVSCKVLVLQGLDMDETDCAELTNIKVFQHPKYFNCYTIQKTVLLPDEFFVGYSITLQLGNYGRRWYSFVSEQRQAHVGALVGLHPPGTYPDLSVTGHHLSPGANVNLRFNIQHKSKLPAPHGACTNMHQETHMTDYINRFVEFPFKYTQSTCHSLNLEARVRAACHCHDETLMGLTPVTMNLYPRNHTCGRNMETYICAERIHKSALYEVMLHCGFACQELTYVPEISHSFYPPDPISSVFYNDVIRGRPFESAYASVKAAIQANVDGNLTHEQRRDAITMVEANFARINAYLGRQSVFDISDEAQLSATKLMSELGGTLNFWAGITLAFVIEVTELFINVICRPKDAVKEKKQERQQQQQQQHRQELQQQRQHQQQELPGAGQCKEREEQPQQYRKQGKKQERRQRHKQHHQNPQQLQESPEEERCEEGEQQQEQERQQRPQHQQELSGEEQCEEREQQPQQYHRQRKQQERRRRHKLHHQHPQQTPEEERWKEQEQEQGKQEEELVKQEEEEKQYQPQHQQPKYSHKRQHRHQHQHQQQRGEQGEERCGEQGQEGLELASREPEGSSSSLNDIASSTRPQNNASDLEC